VEKPDLSKGDDHPNNTPHSHAISHFVPFYRDIVGSMTGMASGQQKFCAAYLPRYYYGT